MDEQMARIDRILSQARDPLAAWHQHLSAQLTFPVQAEVFEPQDYGAVQAGDIVTILALCEADDVDDLYGILAHIRHRLGRLMFPLCDLEVVDQSDPRFQLVDDYSVWFANR